MNPEKLEIWGRFNEVEKLTIRYIITNKKHLKQINNHYFNKYVRKLEDWEIVKLKLQGKIK